MHTSTVPGGIGLVFEHHLSLLNASILEMPWIIKWGHMGLKAIGYGDVKRLRVWDGDWCRHDIGHR